MSKISREQVLENLEDVKKYIKEAETKKEEKVLGIAIKNRFTGDIIFQSTKTTYKEAIEEKGDANLSDVDLSDVDLSGANLIGADLSEADLSDANLRGADLSDANLRGADLIGADLSGANLSDADLRDANLSEADLSDVDLSGANLIGADLGGAELNCAKFYGRGGNVKIMKKDLKGFLGALGFILEED